MTGQPGGSRGERSEGLGRAALERRKAIRIPVL